MLISSGADRNHIIDRRLAGTLAGVAGALNAAAFYEAGFFSANMTGNVSTLSDRVALGQWGMAAFSACIVASFMLGALLSTLFMNAGLRRQYRGIYALTILIEAALLAALGCALHMMPVLWRVSCFVMGVAFIMGLQNAVSTRISDARVRTTHVSGIVTDIGIGFALLLDATFKRAIADDLGSVRARLRLHAVTLLSFFSGGIAGVLLYRHIGMGIFWGAAAVLAAFALFALSRARRV